MATLDDESFSGHCPTCGQSYIARQRWHLAQDLGPGPHHYISLYRNLEEIARFNTDRREWLSSDEFALNQLVKYLNANFGPKA